MTEHSAGGKVTKYGSDYHSLSVRQSKTPRPSQIYFVLYIYKSERVDTTLIIVATLYSLCGNPFYMLSEFAPILAHERLKLLCWTKGVKISHFNNNCILQMPFSSYCLHEFPMSSTQAENTFVFRFLVWYLFVRTRNRNTFISNKILEYNNHVEFQEFYTSCSENSVFLRTKFHNKYF